MNDLEDDMPELIENTNACSSFVRGIGGKCASVHIDIFGIYLLALWIVMLNML